MTDIEYLKKYMDSSKLEQGLELLKQGVPVQYIVGNIDFYGLNFEITKDVLIPRFETEELVEKTINYAVDYFNKDISILDIGTGSGCIAISLKKNLINSSVDAVDISLSALEIAKKNAVKNNVDIYFLHSNLFDKVERKYDLIISNPPYIGYDEPIMDLVKNNEPHIALYADKEGLYYYEEIIKNISDYLNNKAMIALEIGENQGKKVKEIIKKFLPNTKVLLEKDLQNRDRFIFVFKDN